MDRGSLLDEDDEDDEDDKDDKEDEEEAGGRRRQEEEATDIKSNNPHLAGGESINRRCVFCFLRWIVKSTTVVLFFCVGYLNQPRVAPSL